MLTSSPTPEVEFSMSCSLLSSLSRKHSAPSPWRTEESGPEIIDVLSHLNNTKLVVNNNSSQGHFRRESPMSEIDKKCSTINHTTYCIGTLVIVTSLSRLIQWEWFIEYPEPTISDALNTFKTQKRSLILIVSAPPPRNIILINTLGKTHIKKSGRTSASGLNH